MRTLLQSRHKVGLVVTVQYTQYLLVWRYKRGEVGIVNPNIRLSVENRHTGKVFDQLIYNAIMIDSSHLLGLNVPTDGFCICVLAATALYLRIHGGREGVFASSNSDCLQRD